MELVFLQEVIILRQEVKKHLDFGARTFVPEASKPIRVFFYYEAVNTFLSRMIHDNVSYCLLGF